MRTMKKTYIYTALAAAVLVSCSKVESPQTPQEETPQVYSLTVSLPEAGTKTTIGLDGENYKIYWQDGDAISAGADNLSAPLEGLAENSGSVEFTFSKPVSDGAFVRYPGVAEPSVLVIPAEQTSVGGQYDCNAAPLWGTVSIGGAEVPSAKLTLNNTMAMLRFSITGSAVLTKAVIETLGDEPLNGTFSFSDAGLVSNGTNTATATEITFDGKLQLDAEEAADLYIPVLPASYSKGFSLKLYDDSERLMKVSFFKDGQVLTAENLAEFTVTYAAGRAEVIAPAGILGVENGEYDDQAPANAVKVGTYNIYASSSRDDLGVSKYRHYSYAMPHVAETIVAMDCDVICFNEIGEDTYNTSAAYSLENAVKAAGGTEYAFKINNPNQVSGSWFWTSEEFSYANGFAYKSSTVKLEQMGKFWLNEDASTSSDSDSGGNRTAVWGKFTQTATGKTFYVISTHLSIESQGKDDGAAPGEWNLNTAKNLVTGISSRINPGHAPVIIAGDLNSSATTTNQGYNYLINAITDDSNSLAFADSRTYLAESDRLPASEIGIVGTSVGSGNNTARLRESKYCLDHILFRNCEVSGYKTYRKTYRVPADSKCTDWYPSDHLPLSVYVELL